MPPGVHDIEQITLPKCCQNNMCVHFWVCCRGIRPKPLQHSHTISVYRYWGLWVNYAKTSTLISSHINESDKLLMSLLSTPQYDWWQEKQRHHFLCCRFNCIFHRSLPSLYVIPIPSLLAFILVPYWLSISHFKTPIMPYSAWPPSITTRPSRVSLSNLQITAHWWGSSQI